MSITVVLEILAGVLLIFSALVAAAALWVPPPRSRAAVRRRASSRTPPVEDRPERPGGYVSQAADHRAPHRFTR
ncbi:hypothetical protein ACIBF7_10610 [Nonomuraea sp. NPDC050478]|uniref:hypothetical protein n=1 Tax=Nonomuraea sp. NPDC050478 TaxID=3364365 RepID=UPI0037917FC1